MIYQFKKTVITLFIACSLIAQSCAQTKSKPQMTQEMINSIKTYNTRPAYRLDVFSANCEWEILLNDIPVYLNHSEHGGFSSCLSLNQNILQSGKQTLHIKIFPAKDQTKLGKDISLRMGLKKSVDMNQKNDSDAYVMQYELKPDSVKELPILEYSYEFNAEVPYQVEGWSKCKDLRKLPDLEKKLLIKYQEIEQLIKSKKETEYLSKIFKQQQEKYQAFYASPKEIEEDLFDGLTPDDSKLSDVKFLPFENYKLTFYANGRLAALENVSNPMEGIIRFDAIYKDDKSPYRGFVTYLFGIPEGKNDLEIIR